MTGSCSEALGAFLEDSRAWADRVLETLVPPASEPPQKLHAALRYALFGGGKRLRPALARLVARGFGAGAAGRADERADERSAQAADAAAARPAAALELVHTYSLVHDDLPCMDDDDLRRGRPTVHVAYDEATAVLVGDALLTLAFEVLGAEPRGAEHVLVLARAAGARGMVGGQMQDLSLPRAAALEAISDMHARKTAALFGAAAEMGALAGAAGPPERRAAAAYGTALGLCFQATDDLLDVTGDAATLGKTPGKDAALERATLVAALGPAGAAARADELAAAARAAAGKLGASAELARELVEFVRGRRA